MRSITVTINDALNSVKVSATGKWTAGDVLKAGTLLRTHSLEIVNSLKQNQRQAEDERTILDHAKEKHEKARTARNK